MKNWILQDRWIFCKGTKKKDGFNLPTPGPSLPAGRGEMIWQDVPGNLVVLVSPGTEPPHHFSREGAGGWVDKLFLQKPFRFANVQQQDWKFVFLAASSLSPPVTKMITGTIPLSYKSLTISNPDFPGI